VYKNTNKPLFVLALILNLLPLAFFKYAVFFWSQFAPSPEILNSLILPLGISFYTFQGMSYLIDCYRGNSAPAKLKDFSLYVTFFPQLVAGPIVRSTQFLPQLVKPKQNYTDNFNWGLHRIARGFFLKLVIADNISPVVNSIFATDVDQMSMVTAWFGAFLFSIQIFCDFAGYSEIAIGLAALFGFRLMENFNHPYFARGIDDFWRRWHISLSEWFRDYVYIPLGGNRSTEVRHIGNILIVFLVSGLWHGAAWTFVVWGGLHGLFVYLSQKIKNTVNIPTAIFVPMTFVVVVFLWVPFRAEDLSTTMEMWSVMALGGAQGVIPKGFLTALPYIALFGCFLVFEHAIKSIDYRKNHPWETYLRVGILFALILILAGEGSDFIYFQF